MATLKKKCIGTFKSEADAQKALLGVVLNQCALYPDYTLNHASMQKEYIHFIYNMQCSKALPDCVEDFPDMTIYNDLFKSKLLTEGKLILRKDQVLISDDVPTFEEIWNIEYERLGQGKSKSWDSSVKTAFKHLQPIHDIKINAISVDKLQHCFDIQMQNGSGISKLTHMRNVCNIVYNYARKKKLITLDEYINHMDEGQKDIYFVSGDKVEKIDQLPIVKKVKEKGYEILYLTDNVDEFVLQSLMNYKEKNFKNISQGDLDLDSEEEKKELEKKAEESKDMLDGLKEALGEKVKEVKLSTRLVDDPVCLSADEGMSFEMEKVLSAMPDGNPYGMKATRILEINPSHPIFTALQNVYAQDKDAVKDYAQLLYDQALLIEGFPIDDPAEFSRKICEFMVKAAN